MSKTNLRPTTLTGIKTLAHDLKIYAGVTHTQGLDMASGLAGFPNFQAARKRLEAKAFEPSPPRYPLYISIWWRDPHTRASGRETLRTETSRPLDDLMAPRAMRHAKYLSGLKRVGPDHLIYQHINASQYQARLEVAAAVRTLVFTEATGLVPSRAWRKEDPAGDSRNALPGKDHACLWYDPEFRQYIVTDEPYVSRTEGPPYAAEREAWAARWNMDLRAVEWGGMYRPDGGTRLFVYTDASTGYDLAGLAGRLNALPEPIGSEDWKGDSTPYSVDFVSPGTIAEQALKAAARQQRVSVPRGARNSIPMGGGRTRPAKKLDLATHARMGEFLKAALRNSDPRYRVHKQVNRIRSRLEDWMAAEYSRDELDGPAFFEVYYKELKDESLIGARGEEDAAAKQQMAEVKSILLGAYPDSAPLRNMVANIDRVCGYLR